MSDEDFPYPIYPLFFVAGDTYKLRIGVEDPDPDSPDPENPVMIPRNLTDYSAAAQIRKKPKDPVLLASFVVGVLGIDGFIPLVLTAAASQPLNAISMGVWDLQLTDPYGEVETILGGPVEPTPDVTRV